MKSLELKQLSRFPTQNGCYIVTTFNSIVEDCFEDKYILFRLRDGMHTYLQSKQVVFMENSIMNIDNFKAMLKHYIHGCPELKYIYYEIK